MTLSAGSASYGNQSAAAAPEVVCWPISLAKIAVRYPRSAKTKPQVRPESPARTSARRFFIRINYVQLTPASYKMASDGLFKSRCTKREGARRRTNLCGRGARIVSLASRRGGRAGQCEARFGKGEKLRRTWTRDCHLHCRSKHQLHQRLQCLLQVLRILSNGEGPGSLRPLVRADRSETRRTFFRWRCSNPDARRASPEIAVRMVYRSAASHPGKISTHQCSRIQSAGVSAFRRDLPNAVARSDFGIQESRTRINSGGRRRNSRGSGAEENFAFKD